MPTDHKLGAQCARGDVAALNNEGAIPVGCHRKSRFSCEEANLPPFRGVDHVECGVRIQRDVTAVLKHDLFLLPDSGSMMGGLDAVLIQEGFPEEPPCREKEAGDETPSSESRPPSMLMETGRPSGLGRRTRCRPHMADLFPQGLGVVERELMSRAQALPGLTPTAVLIGDLASMKAHDPFQGLVFER